MPKITEDDIKKRAYALWEEDGRPDGSHDAHWDRAHRELTEGAGIGVVETPLSDEGKKAGEGKAPSLSVVPKEPVAAPASKKRTKTT